MGSDNGDLLVGRGLMATPKKVKPNAVYEKFIDGRMRIVGSGADKEWTEITGSVTAPIGWVPRIDDADDRLLNYVADRKKENALRKQEGGNHYKDMAIQPVEFITANDLGFLEGNVVKYICRHHDKNGAEDIKKAIHYCELLLQTKYGG